MMMLVFTKVKCKKEMIQGWVFLEKNSLFSFLLEKKCFKG